MHAAQDRGAEVWVTEAGQLEAVDGRARALARRVELARPGRCTATGGAWPTRGSPPRRRGTSGWTTWPPIFIRTEPPLDETFTTATLILDLVDPGRTAMVERPARPAGGQRAPASRCASPTSSRRPWSPPTRRRSARSSPSTGAAVVKPVDGFSGRGVLRLDRHDLNLPSLIELATGRGTRPVIVQPFLREVAEGNKRIFVVAGEPVGAVFRFPAAGDFRIGNPTRGGADHAARPRDLRPARPRRCGATASTSPAWT